MLIYFQVNHILKYLSIWSISYIKSKQKHEHINAGCEIYANDTEIMWNIKIKSLELMLIKHKAM